MQNTITEFDEYQKLAYETALPSTKNMAYMLLGLGNEAGELLGKYKKVLRGDETLEQAKDKLKDEASDCFWYLAGIATVLGLNMSEIATHNIQKLKDRQERGVIQGSGDQR